MAWNGTSVRRPLECRPGPQGRWSAGARVVAPRHGVSIPQSGAWLSWLERSLHTAEVGGSSPPAPTATVLIGPDFLERLSFLYVRRARSPRPLCVFPTGASRSRRCIHLFGRAGKQVAIPIEHDRQRRMPGSRGDLFGNAPAAIYNDTAVCRRSWIRKGATWQPSRLVERIAAAKMRGARDHRRVQKTQDPQVRIGQDAPAIHRPRPAVAAHDDDPPSF